VGQTRFLGSIQRHGEANKAACRQYGANDSTSSGTLQARPSSNRPPKDAYTTEQLAEIRAITLIWNHIADFVDWLLHVCLGSPIALLWAVGRSIGSLEAKLDLLTLGASRNNILDDPARVFDPGMQEIPGQDRSLGSVQR
jgi:hypothetical protein